jgi:hypothetical protein
VEDGKELGKEGRDDACRCKCEGCYNNLPHEAIRREAIEGILVRNPDAFRPKILQAGVPQSDLRGEIRVKKEEGGEGGAGGGGGGSDWHEEWRRCLHDNTAPKGLSL